MRRLRSVCASAQSNRRASVGSQGSQSVLKRTAKTLIRVRKQIWVFAERICNLVGNAVPRFKCVNDVRDRLQCISTTCRVLRVWGQPNWSGKKKGHILQYQLGLHDSRNFIVQSLFSFSLPILILRKIEFRTTLPPYEESQWNQDYDFLHALDVSKTLRKHAYSNILKIFTNKKCKIFR